MKAQVLLPKIFNFSFTYNSNNLSLKIGDIVEVPFGKSKEIGVVWEYKDKELKNIKIKKYLVLILLKVFLIILKKTI